MSPVHLEPESQSNLLESSYSNLLVKPITVLIVDDHALVRSAICQALTSQPEIQLSVVAQDYAEAEMQTAQLSPEVIWLDLHIAHSDSLVGIRRLRELSPASRIMALTDVENEQEAFAALMLGVQGYRSKQDVDASDIMTMIHMLCRGELVLRPWLLTRLVQRLRAYALPLWASESGSAYRGFLSHMENKGLAQLTAREREILQFISQGYRDHHIAEGLHISPLTVRKHVQRILSKLGVQNRTEAAYLIHQQLTLEPDNQE